MRPRHLAARSLALCALCLFACLFRATAQVDSGSVTGVITDSSGGIIAGASVTLLNENTQLEQTASSDGKGVYIFSPVPIGTYTISVSSPGFGKSTRLHVTVSIQQQAAIDFTLSPGQLEQSIDVSATPELLQTGDASVGQVVESHAIQALPLNGRNYTFLAQLSAGVTFGQQDTRSENSFGRFTANGTRPTQNNYLLDGIDNNSSIISRTNGKDFVVLTPVDALSEFKVQTNNYSAEFGRAAGAVLNATVKSGTNQFHGDAWEFLRNDAVDAQDFFINAAGQKQSEFRRNQFGFTQGGPIWLPRVYNGRNKTFFFVDYEGTRVRQGNPFVSTVPTLAERNSGYTNFSDLIAGQSGSRVDALNRSYPTGTIFDPATTRAAGSSYVRDPFPGNIIPSARLDPNAVKLLQLLPAPSGPGVTANYTDTPIFGDNTNSFDVRIDHNFSEHDQLFGRYSYSFHEQLHSGPFSGYADGGNSKTNSNLDDRSQNAMIAETHSFSPTLLNQIRVGINREAAIWLQPFGTESGVPEQFGIQGIPFFTDNGGLPSFSIGSLTGFGSTTYLPSRKYGTTPQLTDDVTWNKGSHNIKVGFMAQLIASPFTQPPASRGSMSFSGAYTSVVNKTDASAAIAQFLLAPSSSGYLSGANQVTLSNSFDHALRRDYFGAYIQDDWKLTPKLTLNLGVRWEYFSFLRDSLGNNANLVPNAGFAGGTYLVPTSLAPRLPADFISALQSEGVTVKTTGDTVGTAQTKNFGPRFGLAYQFTPRLVLRAGYGIFFGGAEEIGGSPLLVENFPIEYPLTRTAVNAVTPITPDASIGSIETSFQNLSLAPSAVNPAGITLIGMQYNWKTAYTQSENLFLQYQLNGSSSLSAGYVGSNTRHIPIALASNPVLTLLPPGANTTRYTPYPATALTGGDYTVTEGISNYNSLQVTYEKRLSGGLSFLADFTYAKNLTDSRDPLENDIGGYRAPYLYGFGIRQDYTLADFNVPRALHVSGTYDLPFGTGRRFSGGGKWANLAIGGWSTNWILTVQDGQPFTIGCPTATSSGFGCNALLVPGVDPYAGSSVNHFVNAAAFANPPAVTAIGQTNVAPLGGSGAQVSGPPFRRLDFSLFKQFKATERFTFEFRAECFNLTNTPNFALPSQTNFLNTVAFGKITATRDSPNDPRQMQFGLKLYW